MKREGRMGDEAISAIVPGALKDLWLVDGRIEMGVEVVLVHECTLARFTVPMLLAIMFMKPFLRVE